MTLDPAATAYLPVAEVVAASMCYLARFKTGAKPVDERTTFWHQRRCRFCDVADDELMKLADLGRCDPAAIEAWGRLPRKARAARIYEAQEKPWWNDR